jgi:hypothetical protein
MHCIQQRFRLTLSKSRRVRRDFRCIMDFSRGWLGECFLEVKRFRIRILPAEFFHFNSVLPA